MQNGTNLFFLVSGRQFDLNDQKRKKRTKDIYNKKNNTLKMFTQFYINKYVFVGSILLNYLQ